MLQSRIHLTTKSKRKLNLLNYPGDHQRCPGPTLHCKEGRPRGLDRRDFYSTDNQLLPSSKLSRPTLNMSQEQTPKDFEGRLVNWPRLASMTIGLVVAASLVIWLVTALLNCKPQRRNSATIPRAYLLPVYVDRHSSAGGTQPPATSSHRSEYPLGPDVLSPVHEVEDPTSYLRTRISTPLQAHRHISRRFSVTDIDGNDIHILDSVQQRASQRNHRIHSALCRVITHESARESVETLPRYENPPSYNSNNGFRLSS